MALQETLSQAINSRGVTAEIYYSEGPEVTIKIVGNAGYGAQAGWRVRGENPDTTIYCSGDQYDTEGSFEAEDGTTYYFQAVWGSVSEGVSFTVNFDDDSGGGGSGSGGDDNVNSDTVSKSCSVYASGSGAYLTATVSWSSGPEVDVVVNSTTSWRLVTRGNSNEVHLSSSYGSSGWTRPFNAVDGGEYIFQIYDAVEEQYTNNSFGTSGFTVNFSGGSGGSSSGGDSGDSGGDSGGGSSSNDSLKEYTFTALGVTAKATYTSGPEVTITILSWNGYNSIPYWRIKGVKSEGDDSVYLGQNNKSSNSFDSKDMGFGCGYDEGGKNYIFQVCKDGNWNNDGGSASKFNVDFSINSGTGSGGSSSSATPCGYLIVNQGEGTRLHVQRSWPPERICYTDLQTGEPIYMDGEDTFYVSVEVLDGYELDYYPFDGELFGYQLENLSYYTDDYTSSGERIVFYQISSYGNATITSTATPIATANIYTNSGWNRYALNIYNGTQWNRYTPYIYKDSQWKRYR